MRKALVAAAAAASSALGSALWLAAADGITRGELSGSLALGILAGIGAGLATFGVKNEGQVDLASLQPDLAREIEALIERAGPKPAR